MGFFGESIKNRRLRYLEIALHFIAEHDRTYGGTVGLWREEYQIEFIKKEFDTNTKIVTEGLAYTGIFKWRLFAVGIIIFNYGKKRGTAPQDISEFLNVLSGAIQVFDDTPSTNLLTRERATEIWGTWFWRIFETLKVRDADALAEMMIDILGDSLGQEFCKSSINRDQMLGRTIMVAHTMCNQLNADDWN